MQFARATSWLLLSLCALFLSAAGCDPEDKPGTAIVLLVKSDIEELSSLQVKALDSEDSKVEEADAHTEQASFSGVDRVTPVVVKPGKSDEVLIVVSGFDGTRSKNALAEVSFHATFVEGKTLKVPVFLGNLCVGEFCKVSQTCSGGPLQEARECASIRALQKSEYTVVDPEERDTEWDFDADPLVVTCMDGGVWSEDRRCVAPDSGKPEEKCDGGPRTADGACVLCGDGAVPFANGACPGPAPIMKCDGGTMLLDGGCAFCVDGGSPLADGGCPVMCKSATCDLFPQCGCGDSETCQHMSQTNGSHTTSCRAAGPVAREGACAASSDCAKATTCVDGVCRSYCQSNSDCTASSTCDVVLFGDVEVKGVKVCFAKCDPAASNVCARDTVCTNDPKQASQICLQPQKECQYREDSECDDLTGTRYCAVDTLDCAPASCAAAPPTPPGGPCDLVSQCGCARNLGCYATIYYGGTSMASCHTPPATYLRQGATCDSSRINSCGKGYACVAGRCKRYCRAGTDCPNNTTCDGIVVDNPDAGVGVDAGTAVVRGIKVCW